MNKALLHSLRSREAIVWRWVWRVRHAVLRNSKQQTTHLTLLQEDCSFWSILQTKRSSHLATPLIICSMESISHAIIHLPITKGNTLFPQAVVRGNISTIRVMDSIILHSMLLVLSHSATTSVIMVRMTVGEMTNALQI